MIEWHGWATIRDTASYEWDGPNCETTCSALRQLLSERAKVSNETADLRNENGSWHVWLSGFHNHVADHIVPLYRSIAELAPGSYGLLHIHDDERSGDWICWTMARGGISPSTEARLSPHIDVVEDAPPSQIS
ncbi:MAG: Imm7 family immunity protein [Acidimicrobiales bacterium]